MSASKTKTEPARDCQQMETLIVTRGRCSLRGRIRANVGRPLLSLVLVALVALCLPVTTAYGQLSVDNGCMETVYQAYNGGGTLNCTANDVSVASVTNITIIDDGCQFVGDTVTFEADYEILLTAQARHDVGIYLSTNGESALLGSSCTILTLPVVTDLDGTGDDTKPTDAFGYCSPDGGTTLTIGPDLLPLPCNADGPPDCPVGDTCEEFGPGIQDDCGDIDDAPNPIILLDIVVTAACQDPDGDGRLDLPNCTSWRQPGDNDLCLSPLAAFPGAPSKCNCDPGFDIGICVPGFCDDNNPCTENVCTIDEFGDPQCSFPPESAGTICDDKIAGICDAPDECDGAGNCVPIFEPNTTICRVGSGDDCDPDEACTGSDVDCPADVVASATTICNPGSGDICDPAESCTGIPGDACPDDTVSPPTTICRAGSGDICDPDESCTGVADDACPPDFVEPATTICNPGSGDICDPDESCTGNPGDACPDDTVSPPTTICRPGSGDICDPDESCTGVADDACPPDEVAPLSTPCEADGDLCTNDHCDGEGQCVFLSDVDCDDQIVCTKDSCDPTTGECDHEAVDANCDDGDLCTADICDPIEGCISQPGCLDIKPSSCPNPVNPDSNGIVPVALIGSANLDVTQVDISTIELSRADGVGDPVTPHEGPPGPHTVISDVATPFPGELCDCHELSGDGIDDMLFKFKAAELAAAFLLEAEPPGTVLELVLTGNLFDGTPIEARDCMVRIPVPPSNMAVHSNVWDTFLEIGPLDLNTDSDGFADFGRAYLEGTAITVTAPPFSEGRKFVRWIIDGVLFPFGLRTIEFSVQEYTEIEAIYARWSLVPDRPVEDDGDLE